MDMSIPLPDQRIRIFISSTMGELAKERLVAKQAILDLFQTPVMLGCGANPHPPKELYTAYLQQSNIYVGIFWESYGWVAPGMSISGVEDEYQIARARRMPRFVYIKEPAPKREDKLKELILGIESAQEITYKPFKDENELISLIKNDLASFMTERYLVAEKGLKTGHSIDYLDSIKSLMRERGYVNRPQIKRVISNLIKSNNKILLFGKPGTGKTFIAASLCSYLDGIYISVKGKTALQIFTHLIYKLAPGADRITKVYSNEAEARIELDEILEVTKKLVVIDDIDKNPDVARALLYLDYFRNKVVFVARSRTSICDESIVSYEIIPFNEKEIREYLKKTSRKLSNNELKELMKSSEGNPLYLYYFSHFSIKPLPVNLEAYQEALWQDLTPIQKSLLGIISISLFRPSLDVVYETVEKLESKNGQK